jgi:hypothetical protein
MTESTSKKMRRGEETTSHSLSYRQQENIAYIVISLDDDLNLNVAIHQNNIKLVNREGQICNI